MGVSEHVFIMQLWEVTEHMYSSSVLKYNCEVLLLCLSIIYNFLLLYYNSETDIALFTPLLRF